MVEFTDCYQWGGVAFIVRSVFITVFIFESYYVDVGGGDDNDKDERNIFDTTFVWYSIDTVCRGCCARRGCGECGASGGECDGRYDVEGDIYVECTRSIFPKRKGNRRR